MAVTCFRVCFCFCFSTHRGCSSLVSPGRRRPGPGVGQWPRSFLRRPRVYEVGALGRLLLSPRRSVFSALRVVRPNVKRWLPPGSRPLGLAAASRPPCAIVAVLIAILYGFYLIRRARFKPPALASEFAHLALPSRLPCADWLYNYSASIIAGVRHPLSSGSPELREQRQTPGREVAVHLLFSLLLAGLPANFMPRFPFSN